MTETAAPVAAPPAAVLWDMDGTLVDTEPYWMACEHELVASFGGTWTDEDAQSIIGYDLIEAAVVIRERGGVDLEPEEIVERLLDGVIARVREHVPWRPGARRLLSELNALGVPCALVTMSWARLVDAVVEALAPISFQAVVTGDTVEHGKPHPEPYLLAAERLGVDPVQCVAIEDSPTGVTSAGAAGCVVVAVPNIVPIDPAPGRYIVSTLKGLEPGDLGLMVATTPETSAPPSEPERGLSRRAVVVGAAALALVAVVVALVLRRDDDADDAAAPPVRPPIPVAVHAWTPYWALEDALPELEARAPTMAQLSPFWWVTTDVESIEVQPNTPAEEAEQFLETARQLGVPLVASILDGTEPGVMAEILADPDATVPARRHGRRLRRRRRLPRHRHRLRAVRLRRRARHLGLDAPELGRLRRGARRPPARRRADPDRQRAARVRRRADRRERVLGLRLRRHHAARGRHPGDGVRLLSGCRGSPDPSPRWPGSTR